MKKIIIWVLSLVILLSLASCEFFDIFGTTGTQPQQSVSHTEIQNTTRPTTTNPPTNTTATKKDDASDEPVEDKHIYTAFTASEKQILTELFGEVIPFISNDEYYFETSVEDADDGSTVYLVNFYTYGNTKAEFEAYRASFSDYTYEGNEVDDEYGDVWYYYTSEDDTYFVDIAYYESDDGYIVDVYAYFYKESEGGSADGEYIYTSFAADEKALFNRTVGAVIPFLPNNEYYVEEYTLDHDNGSVETGVNFYTYGNTQAEFDAYRVLFSSYDYDGTGNDEYGDAWYYYTSADGSYYVDMAYYEVESGCYVVDVYAYYLTESGSSGGDTGDSGNDTADVDVITNEGAGLPEGENGVFNVDFTDAEYVKNVTEQGYYEGGCPTTGSPAVLVIPVQFSDALASEKGYTVEALENAFLIDGTTDYYSLYDYYFTSSYGQLTLDITVLDEWFTPQYDSTHYYGATFDYYGSEVAIGDQMVMDEALSYLADTMDLSKYDSDGNGMIDAVVLVNTLEISSEETFYWAYRYWNIYTDDEGYYYEYDGVSANDYVWAPYQFLYETYDNDGYPVYDSSVMNTYTFIHEFAHILGVDDYYDTAYVSSPLDGCDVMDAMKGDHNAYSKFNLGWLTESRLVTAESSVTLTLEDFSKNGDTIILANDWDEKLGVYQEYYILVYYTNNALNAGEDNGYFSRDGIVVYHVNASLYKEIYDGVTYYDVYNNNTDPSDEYGTEDNLIEYVKSAEDTYTFVVGSTLGDVYDDSGEKLGYTFVVDELNAEYATITFTVK